MKMLPVFVLALALPGVTKQTVCFVNGGGDVLAWIEVAPIPAERKNHTPAWSAGPWIYCMLEDSEDSWVTRQGREGALEPWQLVKKCGFTTSKWGNPCASLGARVYAFGHWGTSRTATIDAGGRMSPWKNAQKAPSMGKNEPVLWGAGTLADLKKARFLYHAGGFEYEGENFTKGRSQNKVFVAGVLADGTLTDWRQTTPLPVWVMSPSIAFHDGWLYVFGGFSRKFAPEDHGTDRMVESIFAGKVEADGSVAEWRTLDRRLPWTGMGIACFVRQGRLYLAGGETRGDGAGTATAFTDRFARATLEAGQVGEWETLPSLPGPAGKTPNAVIGDWFYIVGISGSGKTPVYALKLPK